MVEMLPQSYMGKPATPIPIRKRVGIWVLAKHRYGYTIYHFPEGSTDPKAIPDYAIDPTLKMGDFLKFRPGLDAIAAVADRFPDFDREADVRALKAFLDERAA